MTKEPEEHSAGARPGAPPGRLAFQGGTGYLLGRVGAIALQRWGEVLARFKVTPTQAKVLMALGEMGRVGQQQLAEVVGIDPRNAVPVTEALVEARLISRKVDASDRRRRLLELTASGRRLTAELTRATARNDDDLLTSLPPAARARLRVLLRAVLDGSNEDASHP